MDRIRFEAAFRAAVRLAEAIARDMLPGYVDGAPVRFDFRAGQEARPGETIKMLGGRLLTRSDLIGVSLERTRKLLWIDGRVPTWINIQVDGMEAGSIVLVVSHAAQLAPRNGPWRHEATGHAPFHVLGPSRR